jgi:hypothetical protein
MFSVHLFCNRSMKKWLYGAAGTLILGTNKLLYDELDERGLLLYAKIEGKIIATFRVNIGLLTDFPPELVQEFSMDRFQKFYKGKSNPKFALMSKVMVCKPYRNTPAFQLLSAKSYRIFCNARVQFCFGIRNFYLLPLYEYFGYRRYIRNSIDLNYGSTRSFRNKSKEIFTFVWHY